MFWKSKRPEPPTPQPATFRLSIDPNPPYLATLHCPGGVTKLLSEKEAYRMLCERALSRWATGRKKGA